MTDSKVIKIMGCDKCGSSDGNKLYDDGHAYCYVCNTRTNPDGITETKTIKKPMRRFRKY